MRPTAAYTLFDLASELGQTAAGLLTGQVLPLGNLEHYLWNRWRLAQARLQQQQARRRGNKGG